MRNKKGFTLVELVIVIAVIAILAGVMIGTFASVVKKAKESAKMQEMANQKQQQMIDDIDAKLKDDAWLGWEDFETKLAEAVSKAMSGKVVDADKSKEVKAAVEEAVSAAFAKYASSLGTGKTGLTEEQVKYIVESALAKNSYTGVTEAQVKAIVNNAVSGTSTLTKAQVNTIVSQIVNAASNESKLTLSQINIAIQDLIKKVEGQKTLTDEDITTAVTKAMKDFGSSTLTTADIEALLAKYVSNGTVKGDYTWYNANATTMEITGTKAAEQVVALSTMAKGGTSFAGKTITIAGDVDLTKVDFDPIVDFDGTLKGTTGNKVTVDVEPVWNTAEGRNGKTMMNYFQTGNSWYKDAVAYGLVASLKEGGVVEGLTVELNVTMDNPGNQYTYFGGIVGFLDGGTIRDCKVTGTIDGYNRIGGVVGYAKAGTIERVNVDVTINAKRINNTKNENGAFKFDGYSVAGGLIGYASAGDVKITTCNVKADLTITGTTLKGAIVGQLDNWKNANSSVNKEKVKEYSEWDTTGKETAIILSEVNVIDSKTTPVTKDNVKPYVGTCASWNENGKTFDAVATYVTVVK